MRFRPCIDLHEGKVKQIIGKTLSSDKTVVTNFVAEKSPSWYASLYKKDNLYGGHVIMLGKGNEKAALEALKAFENGLQIGGGINDENAKFYLDNGATHVIVTSFVFSNGEVNWDNLKKIKDVVGREKLVLDLSCRKSNGKYYIVTDKWQKFTNVEINRENIKKLEKECSEFLIHAVDVEGEMKGIDVELIKLISEVVTIPVTYAGGITTLDDLEIIKEIGKNHIDFTIGSALDIFGGNLSYKKVVEWHKRNNFRL